MMNVMSHIAEKVLGDSPTSTTQDMTKNPTGEKMKALAWFGKADVRLIDADKPQVIEPTDVVVRVTGTTVCGSDLHLYQGEILQLKKGDILGHEFCGVIESAGSQVKLKPGQRVVASFQVACGSCEYCRQGLSSMCDTTNKSTLQETMYGHKFSGIFGYSHFAGGFAGGQAEYVRVPFADVNLLPLPDNIPDEKGLYLSDIIVTSYHACKEADIKPGDVVGVWGLGPIGLHVAQWCKLMGASRIIGIDNVKDRLDFARARLAIETFDFGEKETVKGMQELVPGGIDKAIDCAGFRYAKGMLHKVERAMGLETDTSEIINEEVMLVKKFGTVALIADYAAYTNHLNIGAIMEKGIRLIGCGQCPVQKYWKMILDTYIVTGKFDPTVIVSHRFPLEEVAEVYAAFNDKKYGILKVFLETRHSFPAAPGTPALTSVKHQSQ